MRRLHMIFIHLKMIILIIGLGCTGDLEEPVSENDFLNLDFIGI